MFLQLCVTCPPVYIFPRLLLILSIFFMNEAYTQMYQSFLTGSSNSTGNLATETHLPSTELTASELTEAFEYVLCKLTKGSIANRKSDL